MVLVYDITRRESFNHLGRWLEEACLNGNPSMKVIMVGNKMHKNAETRRAVSLREGELFAQENGISFCEILMSDANEVGFLCLILAGYSIIQSLNQFISILKLQFGTIGHFEVVRRGL